MKKLTKHPLVSCMYGVFSLLFICLFMLTPSWGDPPSETPGVPPGPGQPGSPSWTGKAFRQGVVAVSQPLAAEAGAKILEGKGNAIDAVAAIQFALEVTEPQFSGIGGGGFMMIHLAKTGETFALDCREKAPAAATPDMFMKNATTPMAFSDASTSGISVGVPGTLGCVATALEHWGTISLSDALQPGIKLAAEGFHVNKFLAADSASFRTALQPETKAVFRRPDGSPLQEGDLLVQPVLAKTFQLIAKKGPDVFYRGEISQAIIDAQLRTGNSTLGSAYKGRMSLDDLDKYDVKIRQPIVGDYRGFTLKSMSPPSSGGLTIIQMLKMLERFPLGDESKGFGFGMTETLHVMIESMRLAFSDRAVWMGDEDFVEVPKVGLIADAYVDLRSALIKENSTMSTPSAGDPWPYNTVSNPSKVILASLPPQQEEGGHTTHFAVVDKWGNIVSYTTTIEQGWGTGIMVPGYGFLLNNELTDFNFAPTLNPGTGNPGANDVAAYKRPRSSMVPSMLFMNGEPIAAYGSPGGATIINSVLQITLNLIDHGMAIQDAIDAPRISVTSASGGVSREAGFTDETINGLIALGHKSISGPTTIGSVQAVVIDLQTGKQYGGADSRREGTVIGLPRPQGMNK